MKKIILSVATFFTFGLFAFGQAPQKMQYQAVARDNSGTIIANQAVNFKISIVSGSANGTVEYSETHNANTNNFGLVNLQIGSGTVVSGAMNTINWDAASHYVKIEMDANGGSNYQLMGTSQLLSVPYALHAKTAENTFSGDYNDLTNQPTLLTSPDDADADPTNEIQTLSISGSDLTLSNGGGSVTLPASGSNNGIITIDNTNYTTVSTGIDDIINIQGTLNITADYTKLDRTGTSISGGKITGTGTEEVEFGSFSTVKNVQFTDVVIAPTSNTTFINCKFTNVSSFGFNGRFISCDINNCNTLASTNTRIESFIDCEIDNSVFARVNRVTNCEIDDVILGGDYANSPNSFHVGQISNCVIDDSEIYLEGDFTGNKTDDVTLHLLEGAQTAVSGNHFDNAISGQSSTIIVDVTGTAFTNINISGNIFDDPSGSPCVNVTGTFTGSYNLIKISNNTFLRGSSAIGNTSSSNVNIAITDNALKSVSTLGVSNGGNVIVRDNDMF